jgi:hypothetical protein
MPHLVRWFDELGDYGLVILGSHVQAGSKDEVRAKAASLGVNFTIANQARVKDGNDFSGIPHCILFDATGKCVYRGHPDKVEKDLRATLARSFAEGIDKPHKPIAAYLDTFANGQPPAQILPKVLPLLKSNNAQTAEEAKKLVNNLCGAASKRVETARAMKADDPVAAYGLVEKVPASFRGAPVAARASELLAELKKDMSVQRELKARPSLDAIRKLDHRLVQSAANAGVADLADSKFLKANAVLVNQLKRAVLQMHKSFGETKAAEQASVIGQKYGIAAN